jgi:hypothetical protein
MSAAAMSTTTAVEASASTTVESATDCAATIASSYYATAVTTADEASGSIAVSATESIAVATAEAVSATEPRTGADEDASIEPRRAVVAVGCAGVGCVVIVAVVAGRRAIGVAAAIWNSGAEANRDLSVREGRRDKEDTEQSEIAKIAH